VLFRSQSHRDSGEFEAAESVNRHALEFLEPRVADGDDKLAGMFGALLFEQERLAEALTCFKRILRSEPDNAMAIDGFVAALLLAAPWITEPEDGVHG
jgi:tetratricopeptide (TPR) repeat protein